MNLQCRVCVQFLIVLAIIGIGLGFNNERISKSHLDFESDEIAENSQQLHSRRQIKNRRDTNQKHLRKRRDWPNNFGPSGWNQINQSPSPYGESYPYNFNRAFIPYENQRIPNTSGSQVNNYFLPQSSPNPQSFYPNFGFPHPFFGSPFIFIPVPFCPQYPKQPAKDDNAGSTNTGTVSIGTRVETDEDPRRPPLMVNPNDYYNSDTGISLTPIKPLRPPSEPVPSVSRVVGSQNQRPAVSAPARPLQNISPSMRRRTTTTTTEAPVRSPSECIPAVMSCCNSFDEKQCIRDSNCFFFDDPCEAVRKSLESISYKMPFQQ